MRLAFRLSHVRRRLGEERGTTLIELAITGIVMSIISASVLSVWARTQSEAGDIGKRRDFLNDSRFVMNQMTKEIRQSTKIYVTQPDRFEADTLIGGVRHRIKYTATGTTLKRKLDSGAEIVVLGNLTTTNVFAYTMIDSLLQQVSITLSVKTEIPNGIAANFGSTVQLRNI